MIIIKVLPGLMSLWLVDPGRSAFLNKPTLSESSYHFKGAAINCRSIELLSKLEYPYLHLWKYVSTKLSGFDSCLTCTDLQSFLYFCRIESTVKTFFPTISSLHADIHCSWNWNLHNVIHWHSLRLSFQFTISGFPLHTSFYLGHFWLLTLDICSLLTRLPKLGHLLSA